MILKTRSYNVELQRLLVSTFVPAGHESTQYDALVFCLDGKNIVYRKGKVTPDRPGAFLAVWQRPLSPGVNGNKPVPLNSSELDYLFVRVQEHANVTNTDEVMINPKQGMFIFPVALLIKNGIVSSATSKGKTGFRVFPPWSQDRGVVGTKVFSASGKKTQSWQLPYFVEIDEGGLIDPCGLNKVFPVLS